MDDSDKRRREAPRRLKLGYDRVDLGVPDPFLQRRPEEKAGDTEAASDREVTLPLRTSWDYLRSWLHRHTAGHPIPGASGLSFRSHQTHAFMTGMKFEAVIEGSYQGEVVVPLFEFVVLVQDATCWVAPRCNEPPLLGYFRSLLLAIAERWPEVREIIDRFLAKLPEIKMPEDEPTWFEREKDAFQKQQRGPQFVQPSLDSANADLAELNSRLSAADMKRGFGRHHRYDPQRLLYILNRCLGPAHDACELEGENWMSQGQKYIMLQSPGVDETELSRYLSNARRNGLLEWRGVPLPGKPLTK